MGDVVQCRLCRVERQIEDGERRRLEGAARLVKKDGTGMWRGGSYVNSQYIDDECDSCRDDDSAAPSDAPVALQMALVRRHLLALLARGVAPDDAVAYAVARQMIRAEVRRWPAFVAHYTGLAEEVGIPLPTSGGTALVAVAPLP